METCENCHRQIGALEVPLLFAEHVVRNGCYSLLAAASPPLAHPIAASTNRCSSCGSDARPIKRLKSNFLFGLMLFFVGVLPGVIYVAMTQGKGFYCPASGFKYGDAA